MERNIAGEFEEALKRRLVPTLKGDAWRVCKGGYLIKGRGEGRYLVPKHDVCLESKWRTVNLTEERDLVPDFVKAYRKALERCKEQPPKLSEFEEPILGFVGRYGLGITGEFQWAGGQGETLRNYVEVMQYVAPLVRLLEALLSDEEAVIYAALRECPDVLLFLASADDIASYLDDDGASYRRENGEEYEMGVVEHALIGLGYVVAHWFHKLCFPFAIPEPHARHLNQMDTGWGFSNLAGAMFWHLFQLLGAQGRVTRCKQCGDLIIDAHKNTEFCRNNSKCRNRYDHQSGRRAERARRKTGGT